MSHYLQATTKPGARMIAMAEDHAQDFAGRAAGHDRDNSYVAENMRAMQESGFLAACAPAEYCGLGVKSLLDLMIAISRIARGCASSALCANMHMAAVWRNTRNWEAAVTAGDREAADKAEFVLEALGESAIIVAGAASERGAPWNNPRTEAVQIGDAYIINGTKAFVTNSEIADSITAAVRIPAEDGSYRQGEVVVPAGTPGMTTKGNWDAVGMRGSGSHDVAFDNCRVPLSSVNIMPHDTSASSESQDLLSAAIANFPLLGTYLGIAEAAYEIALASAAKIDTTPSSERTYAVRHQVAEMRIDITTAQGVLLRCGCALDELFGSSREVPQAEQWGAIIGWQSAKLQVNRLAGDVVDRAMTVCGGASYSNSNPLSRLYRDVRAGAFMQPLSPIEAYDFIGRTAISECAL